MKRVSATILIAAVIMAFLIAGTGVNAEQTVEVIHTGSAMIPMPVPTTAPMSDTTGNYTRLEIIPSNTQFTLKPGESKEMTVTVRNRDTKTTTLHPAVRVQPINGPYMLDSSWITISPQSADVPAGGSTKITIRASVPADALRGSYNTMIVFTDQQYPSPYPTPYPNYVHQMNVGVTVVSPPVVQIATPFVSDQIEAGKEYRYNVEITNTGTATLQLNPKVGSDSYPMYGPSGPQEPALTESAFSINAPRSLPPGTTGTLNIVVNVPASSNGYYNGNIDLGIDDPTLREGEGRIQVNFNIWKQPPEAYVKKFTMDTREPISIELTSGMSMFGGTMPENLLRDMPVREPTFDTTLTGPEGAVAIRPIQKIIKGSVSLGTDPILSASQKAGTYQETNTQYIVTYAADGTPGAWQLSVMPKNSQYFEYKITLGGKDYSSLAVTSPANLLVPDATSVPATAGVNTTHS